MRLSRLSACVIIVGFLAVAQGRVQAESAATPPERSLTGGAFDRSIARPVMITRENVPLRPILRQLAEQREVAIYLDRRLDPSHPVRALVSSSSLTEALEDIVDPLHAGVSVIADTLYIAPSSTARSIRTLAVIREEELRRESGVAPLRQRDLLRRRATAWPDLAEPREILEAVADRYGLTITGINRIPHDLWASGRVAAGNAPETLLLVLMPFDLAFEWEPGAAGVTIVPIPESIQICREHRPRGLSPRQAVERIAESRPALQARVANGMVEVCGTVEDHEELEYLIGGKPRPRSQAPELQPIQERRFTLRIVRQPASVLFRTLRAQEIDVEVDDEALQAAGIDLDQKISLELKQVTADEFFTAIGKELGLAFRYTSGGVAFFPTKD